MSALLIVGVPRSGTTWIGRTLGATDEAAYVNEPDGFRDPLAFRTMLALGENPILEPGADSPDAERLWAGALAGGRTAGTARDRVARLLFERTPLDDLRAARARGRATGRAGLAAKLAVARVPEPGATRVVVKSVQSALAVEWIVDRFRPQVLLVERNPFNVLASWAELGYVRNPRETAAIAAFARRRWDLEAPDADAPHLALQAFLFGVLSSALRESAAHHSDWVRTRHEDLCVDTVPRFRALAAELGLLWGERAEHFVTDSDQDGTPYRTQRRTEDQPDRWRERLDAEQVGIIRETLARFPQVAPPKISGAPSPDRDRTTSAGGPPVPES
ncbi:MAG TPA: hypothetical protein VGN59_16525 [Acidimicrobiia bacterium]